MWIQIDWCFGCRNLWIFEKKDLIEKLIFKGSCDDLGSMVRKRGHFHWLLISTKDYPFKVTKYFENDRREQALVKVYIYIINYLFIFIFNQFQFPQFSLSKVMTSQRPRSGRLYMMGCGYYDLLAGTGPPQVLVLIFVSSDLYALQGLMFFYDFRKRHYSIQPSCPAYQVPTPTLFHQTNWVILCYYI